MLAGCGRGPKRISRSEYAATEKAVTALQRAYDYRDQARVSYDPRLLDAQKAVEEIPGKGSGPAGDAQLCLYALEAYQNLLAIVRMDMDSVERGSSWGGASAAKSQEMYNIQLKGAEIDREKGESEARRCITNLRSYLE
jgi:hypothetical protein